MLALATMRSVTNIACAVGILIVASTMMSSSGVWAESSCQHEATPKKSFCSGCPPTFEGKPCASTTRYNDMTKGACGCGSEPNPLDFWTKSGFTAAGNAMMMGPSDPFLSWCPENCGRCFRLCTTGGTTTGLETTAGSCVVVMLENRCGDGYMEPGQAQWCRQRMSPWDCLGNPSKCAEMYNTNDFGYPAHFDLQDANLQITSRGWDNVEVTFEEVNCSEGGFGNNFQQDCFCASQ